MPKAEKSDTAGVIFPPSIPAVAIIVAVALETVVPLNFLPPFLSWNWQIWAGIVVLVVGFAIAGSAIITFSRTGTPVNPHKPSLKLANTGPYRFTRNPMYLGFLFDVTGVSLIFSLEWGLIMVPFVWLALDRMVIAREEIYLRGKFGADYEALLKKSRRWI